MVRADVRGLVGDHEVWGYFAARARAPRRTDAHVLPTGRCGTLSRAAGLLFFLIKKIAEMETRKFSAILLHS